MTASIALARLESSFAYFQRITSGTTGASSFAFSQSAATARAVSSSPDG